MKNYIIISVLLLSASTVFSQDSDPIEFMAFYTNEEIRLRWSVQDQDLWEWGNQVGYTIQRVTTEENGNTLNYSERAATGITLVDGLKPLSEAEIDDLYPNNIFAQTGKELLYNDSINDQRVEPVAVNLAAAVEANDKQAAQFVFSQVSADMDFETAQALALGYIDYTIEANKKYSYKITFSSEPVSNLSIVENTDLESGLGRWKDGGTHCVHKNWGQPRATSGVHSILIRNKGATANTSIEGLDFSHYAKVRMAFSIYTVGLETDEGFSIQVAKDGGAYEDLRIYRAGTHLENKVTFRDSVILYRTPGADNIDIRFQMNSNENNDQVFIDDLLIEGLTDNHFELLEVATYTPEPTPEPIIDGAVGQDSTVSLEWDLSGDNGKFSYYDIERALVSAGPSCQNLPTTIVTNPLPNAGWNNQYNVGGTPLTGDGQLCFSVTDLVPYQRCMIGLNNDPHTNASYTTINNAMYIWHYGSYYRVYIFENGGNKGLKINQTSTYEGQTFCIRRTGTTIEYLLDDTVFYTSTLPSTGDLYFDNSFLKYGVSSVKVDNIQLCPSGGGTGNLVWEKVNELPFVPSQSVGINTNKVNYADSIPDNNSVYAYRICGKTIYGTLSPPSDTIQVQGRPGRMDIDLVIDTSIYSAGPHNLVLEWAALDPDAEDNIIGYDIYHSLKYSGPFSKLNTETLNNTTYAYIDIDPQPTGYYMIAAEDRYDHQYKSLIHHVQLPDSIPPTVPIVTSVEFISDTEVQVKWNHVMDSDLSGYRVSYANGQNGTYMQINSTPVKTNSYVFPIDPRTEIDSLFIKVSAEDFRQNISDRSPASSIARPDIYAPSPPVISKVSPTPNGIEIAWIWSTTDDVTKHILERRAVNSPTWMEIVSIETEGQNDYPTGNFAVSYTDSSYVTIEEYEYRFVAYDDNYNLASSKRYSTRPYQVQVEGQVSSVGVALEENMTFVDPDVAAAMTSLQAAGVYNSFSRRTPPAPTYNINFTWTYPLDPRLLEFKIYRSITGGPMQLYRTVSIGRAMGFPSSDVTVTSSMGNTNFRYEDKNLTKNKRYTYQVKAVHKDGSVSHRSSSVSKLVQ